MSKLAIVYRIFPRFAVGDRAFAARTAARKITSPRPLCCRWVQDPRTGSLSCVWQEGEADLSASEQSWRAAA